MNKLALKVSVLALIMAQSACADGTGTAVAATNVGPDTGVSTSTAEIETKVLINKAADNAKAASSDDEQITLLRAQIDKEIPGMPIKSIMATPVDGVYELVSEGQIYYINEDASFLLTGNMIDLETEQNLTEIRLGGLHMELLEDIDESNMLIYEPEEASDRSITVFTDISCGYCRLLHEQIDTLLDAGVRVRYLMFPRAGLGSPGHQALESVWCADDPQKAMTTAKAGGQVDEMSCDNPIENHVEVAQQVGLRGTPLIYLDTGERVHGYREAAVLAKMVNDGKPYVVQ
ncbi:MAG: DsbC family protein [Granulosicoccaceae bacterium]